MNVYEKNIKYSVLVLGLIGTLTHFESYAGTMGPATLNTPGRMYVGVFGGGGTSTHSDLTQFGTAFFLEGVGGPLAVNAFGQTNRRSAGLIGAHVGYQWSSINLHWSVVPAIELEGFYLSRSSFNGHEINNDTTRLSEHDFDVTYPMSSGVFLTNAVLNFNSMTTSRFHPYVGAGIGAAVVSIKNAYSLQGAPSEPNVNHYNSDPNDKDATFAAQGKVGVDYDLSLNTSLFIEYRGLYLADTDYTFGSTVYPTHVATSSWGLKLDSQFYNLGAVGVHFYM